MDNKNIAKDPRFLEYCFKHANSNLIGSISPLFAYVFDGIKMRVDVGEDTSLYPKIEIKRLGVHAKRLSFKVPMGLWEHIVGRFDPLEFDYETVTIPLESWMCRVAFQFVFRHYLKADEYKRLDILALASEMVVTQKYNTVSRKEKVINLKENDGLMSFSKMNKLLLNNQKGELNSGETIDYYYRYFDKLLPKIDIPPLDFPVDVDKMNNIEDLYQYLEQIKDSFEGLKGMDTDTFDDIQQNMRDIINNTNSRNALENLSKQWGDKSLNALIEMHKFELKEPVIKWDERLRNLIGSSDKLLRRNTFSKRHPAFRKYRGVPGYKDTPKLTLWIATDTSGSIGLDDIEAFFNEIDFINRKKNIGKIVMIEADAGVCESYIYRGVPPNYHGGGGTDFNEAIKAFNKSRKGDIMIYFTDGYADTPEILPNKPLIWVITSKGTTSYVMPDGENLKMCNTVKMDEIE